MSNKNEEQNNNNSIKIETLILNPERNLFENSLRKQYSKSDIGQYFEDITEVKLISWENLLEPMLQIHDLSKITDADILNEKFKDPKVEKIIKGDIVRTRVQESIYMTSFKEYVYQIIIFYLNQNKIPYKQGLNEIAGLFVLLKYKLKVSLSRIYKLFVCFIDKYLTNYFHEKEFYSLKSTFSLINLLLRYHDPEIFHLFEHLIVIPELYATSWIMTLFSNKLSLNVIYYLWDKIILFNDNLFTIFFITSMVILHRDKYFNCDSTMILSFLSQLEIKEIEEVNKILKKANEIRDKTPNSIYLLATKLDIFHYDSQALKTSYEYYKPHTMLALPMFPNEIFCITQKNIKGCPDENCENFLKKECGNLSKCIFCRNKQVKRKNAYIILDLRIFEENEKSISETFSGFLPQSVRLTAQQLSTEVLLKNIVNEYENEKNNYHFILITSETGYFEQYEKEFYKDQRRSGNNKFGINYKRYRELNEKKVEEKFKNHNKKEYRLLKEFDNFKKIIQIMNKKGFKYVSYVYGGYKQIHYYAKKYKIDLLEHGENCFLCKEEKQPKKRSSFFNFW